MAELRTSTIAIQVEVGQIENSREASTVALTIEYYDINLLNLASTVSLIVEYLRPTQARRLGPAIQSV